MMLACSGVLVFVSCKKDYFCECSWPQNVNGQTQIFSNGSTISSLTRDKAQKKCNELEETYSGIAVNCAIK